MNPSDIIYKKALESTISAVKRGVESDRAINAGINVIRGTSWFQTKNFTEQKEIESSFRKSMRKEFGLEVTPEVPSPVNSEESKEAHTEVIDKSSIPKAPISSKSSAKAPLKAPPRKEVKARVDPQKKVETKPIEKPIKVETPSTTRPTKPTTAAAQAIVQEQPKKKRGMGLGAFIVSLVFLGFLAWISWILYHHEASIENIVVYENDKLIFKEAFPSQPITVLGQEIKLQHAISRKTNPIRIYRPKSGFPFFEISQEVPCPNCEYWTNVQNYDKHHYPDKK